MLKRLFRAIIDDDPMKFKVLASFVGILVFTALLMNIFDEYLRTELLDYLQRKTYFERVISPKGLPLHRGMHWQEKQ